MDMRRLHIGASSLELLAKSRSAEFIDPTWIHLGDPPNYEERSSTGSLRSDLRAFAKRVMRKTRIAASDGDSELQGRTDFRQWVFHSGDSLDIANNSITFAYSEHVLEHFRYDLAVELFSEVYRVLAPGSVIRTVVPDADYRSYEAPEPIGYPGKNLRMDHPNKHKVRWNEYMLARTLEFVGFTAIPVVYCSEDGVFHPQPPGYGLGMVESELLSTLRYVQRPRSLIVDGLKPLNT